VVDESCEGSGMVLLREEIGGTYYQLQFMEAGKSFRNEGRTYWTHE
jgi:hypothetical protein